MAEAKPKGGEAVMVVVRMRPFNTKEKNEGRGPCITLDVKTAQVAITNPAKTTDPPKSFTFDYVYDMDTQQKHFYEESCYGLIESVMGGFNGTIFAYGQTGCGKTWTMQGLSDPLELRGVIPNSFDHIFQNITADPGTQFLVRCSYLEIYNEEVRDLLGDDSKAKLQLKEDPGKGVFVKDLTEEVVKDVVSINTVMDKGFNNRTVGATLMNAGSSRSHSIFTVVVEANETAEDGKEHLRAGKLNLVDLAGSERQSKTGASGDRLKEGAQINLSLSALGNVISALVDGKGKHIPYRDSKLTRLLSDSLGGNTKTLMVAAISPADYNYEETLSTLRYANRAKNIKNKPKINEDPKDAMLREYKDEINRLRALLEMQAKGLAVELPAASDAPAPAPAPVESAAPPGLAAASAAAPAAAPPGMLASPAELPGGIAPAAMGPPPSLAPPPGLGPPPGLSLGPPPSLAPGTELPPVRTVVEKQIEVVEKVVEVVVEKVVEVERPVEVIPKQHLDQRKAMQDYNASILEQRNRLGEELIAREDSAREADAARRALQQQMEEMKAKVMHGFGLKSQDAGEDLEVQIAKKERERRLMQAKLRAKKKKEAALEAERLQAEQEKKEAEEELQNAREEHETAERRQAKQRRRLEKKLAEVRAEMEDSASEFHRERQDLLQSIIDQNRELKLLEKVLGMILPSSEISKIWERSTYDPETDEWTVPPLKPRKEYQNLAPLPSLNGGVAAVESKEEKRERRKREKESRKEQRSSSEDVRDRDERRKAKEQRRKKRCEKREAAGEGSSSRPTSQAVSRASTASTDAGAALMPADWGFANAALNEPESTSSAPDAVAVAPRSASSNDLVDRAPSRQGGRSKPHENVLGSDVSVGRIRPKSGNRSKNQGGSSSQSAGRPPLAPSNGGQFEPHTT
eukprot:CAMPEP_0172586934 /NCGR_PEP_ID=MMETSP1068-20121228/6129_1 /TAXON_ID=35684 /ORGANISM="Pseudopedinella elastica, Strain CCMP716" /LENGTH=915 /DNA_ID=CAMNT_0013381825 /DNA_START=176 /DNA_END=2923 /DNA_ORIENTATION=-